MSRAHCCPAEPRGHYFDQCPVRHARRAAVLAAVLDAQAANDARAARKVRRALHTAPVATDPNYSLPTMECWDDDGEAA